MTTLIRNSILSAAILFLPGCLAINALLGAAGLLISGPAQYVGTVYSVGEYAYEYAVNDKTPDEVIQEKFAWLTGPDHDPQQEAQAIALAKGATLSPEPELIPMIQVAEVSLATSSQVTLQPESMTSLPQAVPERVIASMDLTTMTVRTPTRPSIPSAIRKNRPQRAPVTKQHAAPIIQVKAEVHPTTPARPAREADPMQIRRDRMEQGLAQAERLMSQPSVDGVRYSVQERNSGQTGTTLSGPWSIRHSVMQPNPATTHDSIDEGVMVTAQLSS